MVSRCSTLHRALSASRLTIIQDGVVGIRHGVRRMSGRLVGRLDVRRLEHRCAVDDVVGLLGNHDSDRYLYLYS